MEMLKKANPALLLVAAIAIKAVIFDVSLAAMLVTVPLLALEGYKLFLNQMMPDTLKISAELRADFQKEIDAVKSKINLLTMEKSLNKPQAPQTQRYF